MKILLNKITSIEKSLAALQNQKLSFKTAYKISNLTDAYTKAAAFSKEKINEIIQEYGAVDEKGDYIMNGENITIKEGKIDECAAKFEELNSVEVDFPDISFSLDDFENVECTPADLIGLKDFITE